MASAGEIVRFWRDAGPKAWFVKNEAFDGRCRAFEAEHHAAARGELAHWELDAEGALALVLLLDQFPRNIYRGSAACVRDGSAWRKAWRCARSSGVSMRRPISCCASSSTCRSSTPRIWRCRSAR